MKEIEITVCDSGDWEIVKVDGKIVWECHSIPRFIWLNLFEELGIDVIINQISDEDMENGNYG